MHKLDSIVFNLVKFCPAQKEIWTRLVFCST